MKYKFKITEDGKPEEEKDGMSFKKILKSLVSTNPKIICIVISINFKI